MTGTYHAAGIGPVHFGEATHLRVEHVHLLHQAAQGCLRGLPHLLVDPLGLQQSTQTFSLKLWAEETFMIKPRLNKEAHFLRKQFDSAHRGFRNKNYKYDIKKNKTTSAV